MCRRGERVGKKLTIDLLASTLGDALTLSDDLLGSGVDVSTSALG